jgi:WD40 repeat protein
LASSAVDNTIRLWDVQRGLLVRTIEVAPEIVGDIPDLAFSPDGSMLVSTYDDPRVSIWSVFDGEELRTLNASTTRVEAVAFSPDGAYLITTGDALRLWGLEP